MAIDIAPAEHSVHVCDFLNVSIGAELVLEQTTEAQPNCRLVQAQASSFDVIVFSLFLSYLPTPAYRLKYCVWR